MHIHYLQHVAFEDAANIAVWGRERGHELTGTRMDLDEPLPDADAIDWLVVMGGPMNVDEHAAYPWLVREKGFIRRVIDRGTRVLGVCLGGQLISTVLGGRVVPNVRKEIGWFPIRFTDEAAGHRVFGRFPRQVTAFHWHGDRFSIPSGGVRLAGSEGCDNQAFQFGRRCLALQFHWDYSRESVETMIAHCGHELAAAPGIQQPGEMLAQPERFKVIRKMLFEMLDGMAEDK
jgi:GMP synthase (glutamine-hydrolysing)